ncbi:MAG: hypothetical protein GEU92_16415 [Alphaproteobacteria bacterium]|nr:hypothetical protein [Alphaproteobacteria bacterium]
MNRKLVFGAVGVLLLAAGGGGWFFLGHDNGPTPEQVAAARALWLRNEEMHEMSVFSYIYPAAGGSDRYSLPVILKLGVRGSAGVDAICNSMPRLREAVLRVFGTAQVSLQSRSRSSELDRFAKPLRRAINRQIPGSPVKQVETAVLVDAGVGGAAARLTDDMCRPYVNS